MASASSSAVKLLIRDGKTAASLLFRARTANVTETVQNTGPAIRSLLRFNQTPAIQYPVFCEKFPVMKSGLGVGFVHQEAVSERRGIMEAAGNRKRVVDNESSDLEEETDYDDGEFDDFKEDFGREFEEETDMYEDEEEEEEEVKSTRKKNK